MLSYAELVVLVEHEFVCDMLSSDVLVDLCRAKMSWLSYVELSSDVLVDLCRAKLSWLSYAELNMSVSFSWLSWLSCLL